MTQAMVVHLPMVVPAELTVVIPCFNERANVEPMVAALTVALRDIAWEAIFVDDDSPDGTAEEARRLARSNPRVRCLRRVGRRGLASAVIEGALSSSADYIAVMDGDLQHDESQLPAMLAAARCGAADIVVASRHVAGGDASGLGSVWRRLVSNIGARVARLALPVSLSDPMSGFFLLPRPLFEQLAPRLTGQGFKILLDLVLSSPEPLRIVEVPASFRPRSVGESKLDSVVFFEFAETLLDKALHGIVPMRFLGFAAVGALGVLVHLAVLTLLGLTATGFGRAQAIATLAAILGNFFLNNILTYRDLRLRGARLWRGVALFVAVCGIGAIANVGIARAMYHDHATWTLAGAAGAAIGVVWNYAVSATLVWRAR
jgi:dolichol-phosphate mannosyltransferase